ncbi:MAG: peptidase dimerization domain protein [Bryobacterales bacterium]|jgi:glutamate carboxypeptidase|nr:peptidase dimerization domain protein [Bryobacterales bacterium]
MRNWAKAQQPQIIALIRDLVNCESPSDSPAGLKRFMELFADSVAGEAKCRRLGTHLLVEFKLPGRKKDGQVLALGHGDTVWPEGTLRTMPFRHEKGRLWGPGTLDMKGGLAKFVFAMRALRESDTPVPHRVVLQLNSDEETGSRTSRELTEQQARLSKAVLVLEPGTGLEGKLKTARKGIGDYRLRVKGIASHSGVDFEKGASAVLELARQIERIAGFTDLERGITVNPGTVSGGTRSNVIAESAETHIDVRVPRLADGPKLDRKLRSLKPFDKRCSIEITGGINRPPMERSKGVVHLLRIAQQAGREIGVEVMESATGGGSDGNFTAALGIPTLDGLGAVGEGAHAAHESMMVDRIADRVALLAALVSRIP